MGYDVKGTIDYSRPYTRSTSSGSRTNAEDDDDAYYAGGGDFTGITYPLRPLVNYFKDSRSTKVSLDNLASKADNESIADVRSIIHAVLVQQQRSRETIQTMAAGGTKSRT